MPEVAAHLRLLRPANGVMMGVIVIVGALIAGGGRLPGPLELLGGFATAFLLNSSAMVLNDIVDVDIDRLNDPGRPLPSGRVSLGAARAMFLALSASGLLIPAFMGLPELVVAALSYVDAVVYDAVTKRTGLLGNFMVAATGVSPIVFGAVMVRPDVPPVIALEAAMIFLAMVGREIAKGVADVEGDRAHGVRTLAVTLGPRRAAAASLAFFAAAVSLSPLPPALGMAGPLAYSLPVAATDVAFIYESVRLLLRPDRATALRAKDVELAVVPLALLGFSLGALRWL